MALKKRTAVGSPPVTKDRPPAKKRSSGRGSTKPAKPHPVPRRAAHKGLTKRFLKTRPVCRVTFRLPREEGGTRAAVAGDFTGWKPVPMKGLANGGFSLTVELPTGASYQFRYIVDGLRWCNDWQADEYVQNIYGCDNCLINL